MAPSPAQTHPAQQIIEIMASNPNGLDDVAGERFNTAVGAVLLDRYDASVLNGRQARIEVAVGQDDQGLFLVVEVIFRDGQPPESVRVEVALGSDQFDVPDSLPLNFEQVRTNV